MSLKILSQKLMSPNRISCRFGCAHERHKPYESSFTDEVMERQYLWNVSKYVMDPQISPSDGDDLELFQDVVFDGKLGRIHIFFYEQLFSNYYNLNADWVTTTFVRYLSFLEKISKLFTNDAFDYIFKKQDSKVILILLKKMPFDIRMRFIQHSEKYPSVVREVPKLKLYNLFS